MNREKVYVGHTNFNTDTNEYDSVYIPTPSIITILIANKDVFIETFDNEDDYDVITQGLYSVVMSEYNNRKSFPICAMARYKADGFAEFVFNRIERNEFGDKLFVYYDFTCTAS